MIKDVKIHNFKGIDNLKLNDLEKINIFVGRNETGKSTILEALAFALSVKNDFRDGLNRDMLEGYFVDKYLSILNLIKIGNKKSEINIDSSKYSLEIIHESEGLSGNGHINKDIINKVNEIARDLSIRHLYKPLGVHTTDNRKENDKEIIEELKQEYIDKILNTETIIIKGYINGDIVNVKLSYEEPLIRMLIGQRRISDFIDIGYTEFRSITNIYSKIKKENPFIFYSSQRKVDFKELHDQAVNQQSIGRIIKKLKEEIDYFQDLRQSEGKFRIIAKGSKKAIPLELRGDGLKSFIYMMFMENILKKGIIIMEEPENYLHPGLMGSLCRDVLSKGTTNQYFISTHNCEMIEYILSQEKLRKDIKIFKMFKDPIDYESIDGNEAFERMMELKEDLRGI